MDFYAFAHALFSALDRLGGLPVVVAIIGGAMVTLLVERNKAAKDRRRAIQDRLAAERRATEDRLAAERAAEAAQAEDANRRAKFRSDPHWVAAAILLREALFDRLPEEFRVRLIDAIIERLERRTHLTKDLLRGARLFIEQRLLLQSAKSGDSAIPLEGAELDAAFTPLAPVIDSLLDHLKEPPETVEFATCFALSERQAALEKYLSTLAQLEQDYGGTGKPATIVHPDEFLTPIRVKDGFVAPAILVSGLLQKFDTDWPRALGYFNAALGGARMKLTMLQRFELYCWLLWGPSIPACTCRGWEGSFLVLQYGYGDETNSFPLIFDGEVLPKSWNQLVEKYTELSRDPQKPDPLPLAFGCCFTGTLVWGPRYRRDDDDYPPVYTVGTSDPDRSRLRNGDATIFTGLMLRADAITWLNEPRRYYSAYLWVMFELYDETEKRPANHAGERWRRLFPVFEHANIADGNTLLFLKNRLAEKACNTVEEIERDLGGSIRLRYFCATDDPGSIEDDEHGEHRFRFMLDAREKDTILPSKAFAGGAQPELAALFDALLPIESNRLRALMYSRLSDQARAVMFAPPENGEEPLTACDLPEIIEEFYRSLQPVTARS